MNNGWGPTSLPASNSLLACGSRLRFPGVGPGTRWTGVHRGRTGVGARLESQTVRPPHPAEWPHRSWCSPAHSGGGEGAGLGPMPVPAPGPAPKNLEGTGEFMGLCCSPGASDGPCLGHSVYCVPSVCHGLCWAPWEGQGTAQPLLKCVTIARCPGVYAWPVCVGHRERDAGLCPHKGVSGILQRVTWG